MMELKKATVSEIILCCYVGMPECEVKELKICAFLLLSWPKSLRGLCCAWYPKWWSRPEVRITALPLQTWCYVASYLVFDLRGQLWLDVVKMIQCSA